MNAEPVVLYTIADLSKRLHKDSTYWVERNKKDFPRVEIGAQTYFTAEQINQIVAMHTVTPARPGEETAASLSSGRITRGGKR